MKVLGNLPLGILRLFKQKQQNRQTNKQKTELLDQQYISQIKSDLYKTQVSQDDSNKDNKKLKKNTNFRSTIYQPNQVQTLLKFQEIFLRVSRADSNKITNKQTNNFFLD